MNGHGNPPPDVGGYRVHVPNAWVKKPGWLTMNRVGLRR